jgi:copper chaperone
LYAGYLVKPIKLLNKWRDKMANIKIKGMSCNHCVMAVQKALGEIDGTTDVNVDLDKGEATFGEAAPVDMNTVREAVKKAGFEVV